MPQRFAKAFYKSKTILTNLAFVCTGIAAIFADVGLDTQAGGAMVAAGVANTALRWITDKPVSLVDKVLKNVK